MSNNVNLEENPHGINHNVIVGYNCTKFPALIRPLVHWPPLPRPLPQLRSALPAPEPLSHHWLIVIRLQSPYQKLLGRKSCPTLGRR